ncbi:MAG: tRNA (guanosine(46)-N7)-methyltransferase TrmB [Oscillospiraceae bacterium]|nr:tRNA (guanosine(46)-N7)-methyltransferase TrmB [Oscillospiraceae bacterium]
MRMRRKKNLDTRLERCGDLWVREPEAMRGRWLEGRTEPELHLEIGCGKGRFTRETAAAEPGALLIAIEREQNVFCLAMEGAQAMGLTNLRFIDGDAAKLNELFAPGEVARIYLNFSDPWHSRRHEKRRLTAAGFLEIYKQILAPGGEIHFKTDNRPLFDFSIAQFPACDYVLEQVTTDLHGAGITGVMTDYEEKFHEMGTPICRCVARWEG